MRKSFRYLTESNEDFSVGDVIQIDDNGEITYDVIKSMKGSDLTCVQAVYDTTDDLNISKVTPQQMQKYVTKEMDEFIQELAHFKKLPPLVLLSMAKDKVKVIANLL